jgi:hypothetical protein
MDQFDNLHARIENIQRFSATPKNMTKDEILLFETPTPTTLACA